MHVGGWSEVPNCCMNTDALAEVSIFFGGMQPSEARTSGSELSFETRGRDGALSP